MPISFYPLVQLYKKLEFSSNSNEAKYCIKNEEDAQLLDEITRNFDDCAIQETSRRKSNNEIEEVYLNVDTPKISLGSLYETVNSYLGHEIKNLQEVNTDFFIKENKYNSFDKDSLPEVINSCINIKKFISYLSQAAAYKDTIFKRIIFFSKKPFELSLKVSNPDELISYLKSMSKADQDAIKYFYDWLDDASTSSHIDEKKAILAFVLFDFIGNLPDGVCTITEIVKNISSIYESIQGQYALYLENFQYEKFLAKMEDEVEKFSTKISESLDQSLPQILGLQVATAAPAILQNDSDGNNWIIYVALLLYCAICYVALQAQEVRLNNIYYNIVNFSKNMKIPNALLSKWEPNEKNLCHIFRKQKKLYFVLLGATLLCSCYAAFKIHVFVAGILIILISLRIKRLFEI